MNRTSLGAALAVALAAGSFLAQGSAQAAPMAPRDGELTLAAFPSYLFGGRNYCWYGNGWRGPGWYWCGYGARYGLGWGGPYGWHHWAGGRPSGGHYGVGHGGQFHGGAAGFHGGDHMGGAHFAGGGHFGGGGGHFGGGGGGHGGGGHGR